MSLINYLFKRGISTTTVRFGKRNFRKFPLFNKRGTRFHKEKQSTDPYPDIPIYKRGVRDVGYTKPDGTFEVIPEMIPQLIVPDLTDCKLKPYVSYRAPAVTQAPFSAEDLFNVVYAKKIMEDFKNGKLDDNGEPQEPSDEEKLSAEEAKLKVRQTGTDLF